MRLRRTLQALGVAAGAAASCDSTRPEDELTLSQSITILRELWMLVEPIHPDNAAPCPLGSHAIVIFESDEQQREDTILVAATATVTPDGCKLSASGDTLILKGAPSIVFDVEGWYLDEDLVDNEYDMAITGSVAWNTSDRTSNSCGVDLTMEGGHMREEYGEIDGYLTGLLCGRDASFHFSEIDWTLVE